MPGYHGLMTAGKRVACMDCDTHHFRGDGKCKSCHGSGTNLNLASDEPKCPFCKGTGVCQSCNGTGILPDPFEPDKFIQTLFD